MSDTWLDDLAPKPGCLSELEIAECAHDDRLDRSHCATCASCAMRLREAEAANAAAAYEAVPQALTAVPTAAPARRHGIVGGAFVSLATATFIVAVVLLPRWQQHEDVSWTTKGTAGIYATVMRGEALVEDDAPLPGMAPLRPMDRMRLRVAGGVASVTVSSWEQGAWQELYRGPVDANGWLPGSITITDTGATRLRVQVCPQASTSTRCTEQTFDL